jgi:Na+/alanine symporter
MDPHHADANAPLYCLTNGFSKKVDNHLAAIALHFMNCNFAHIHQTLRVTPAMEAGLTNHTWTVEEIVALLEPKSILDGIKQQTVDSN